MIYLASFIIAIVFAFLFTGYRGKGSVVPVVVLFFILFMAGLATPFWLMPFGPLWWGVSWLQLFFVMLLIGLLFSIPGPSAPKNLDNRAVDDKTEVAATVAAVSIFAWTVLLILLIAVIIGWFRKG